MSTNSTIQIKRKDGTMTSIYCHWDGYIEGVGVTLQLAYNTAEKVEKLLDLGDLSILRYYTENNNPDKACVAYHRDMGESFKQSGGDRQFVYTFDEEESVWYVEEEQYIRDTKAQDILCLDCFYAHKKDLLLNRIIDSDIEQHWSDDEFAKKGEVITACKQKALDARGHIIKKLQDEYDSWYRAYCD